MQKMTHRTTFKLGLLEGCSPQIDIHDASSTPLKFSNTHVRQLSTEGINDESVANIPRTMNKVIQMMEKNTRNATGVFNGRVNTASREED